MIVTIVMRWRVAVMKETKIANPSKEAEKRHSHNLLVEMTINTAFIGQKYGNKTTM